MVRRLLLRYEDATAFRRDFERDLARGGAFVPNRETFELREIVEVELQLVFCGESLVQEAEIVHCAPDAGVAVQFLGEASDLRQRLERFLAEEGAAGAGCHAGASDPETSDSLFGDEGLPLGGPPGDGDAFDPSTRDLPADEATSPVVERRRAPRATARVPVRLESRHVRVEGRTRDLSETGVLVSADASELPVGKPVRLELTHPGSGERIEVAGRVSRQVEGEGTVAAVGVEFDPNEQSSPRIVAFVREVRAEEARRSEGGISGRIEELGMPNLLQMLGQSSERGTLTARHGDEEGVVAFERGRLRYARMGALRAGKALARLVAWPSGTFFFHAHVDGLDDEDPPVSLDAAILEAVRQLDEARRSPTGPPAPGDAFRVDREALAAEAGFSKIEEAVLDLAAAGMSVRRILDVIPESDAEILAALRALEDRGVLLRRRD